MEINSELQFQSIMAFNDEISQVQDLDAVLDFLLTKARELTKADSGTLYLTQGDELVFSYTQNDTLFKSNLDNKNLYGAFKIPISDNSIAGYVANRKKLLNIPDAYTIDTKRPFSFNASFDKSSGYKTQSILTTPIVNPRDEVVGVLQLINAKDKEGKIKEFSKNDEMLITYFAGNASTHIERAELTREMIMRMIRMAELRDPKETGAHVNRVGAIASELYVHWALKNGIDTNTIKKRKGNIRLAAMLHDVGKIAISDVILKKPGRFDDDERFVMNFHTIFGARLFQHSKSEIDILSKKIALFHHENWDGSGYPGNVGNIHRNIEDMGKGYKGEEIPVEARMVAISDVYDALMSIRSYKKAWTEEDTLNEMLKCSGTQFDPELIDCFLQIYDIVKAIFVKYSDEEDKSSSLVKV